MKKETIIAVIENISNDLQSNLNTSCKDWDEKESHAYIVGYLQSTVEFAISRLNNLINKDKEE